MLRGKLYEVPTTTNFKLLFMLLFWATEKPCIWSEFRRPFFKCPELFIKLWQANYEFVHFRISKICIFYLASWKTWFASFFKIREETKHYILTHFTWFWWIANNVNFIRDPVMKAAYLCKFKFRIGMLLILKYQHSNLEFRILISRTLSRGLAVPRGISHSANCRFRIARAISNLRAWLTVKSHD